MAHKTFPIFCADAPSAEFLAAIGSVGMGSVSLECVCGRTHVAIDSEFLIEGEEHPQMEPGDAIETAIEKDKAFYGAVQERWKTRATENPDGVILYHDCDGVRASMFLGQAHVDGCRCNSLRRYENIFWDERVSIRAYYKARAEKAAQEAAALKAEEAQSS